MRRWRGLLAILLTLGVLAFIVYRLDLGALGRALAGAQYAYIIPLLVTTFVFHWIGALQWRLVLSPVKWVRPLRLFGAQMVGALASGLLPLQVGVLVKAYVVARREQVSMAAILATTLTDRLVNGFAFLGLLGLVLGATDLPLASAGAQAALRAAGWTALGLYLGLAVILVAVGCFPGQGARVAGRVVGGVAPRWAERGAQLYTRFCQGVGLPKGWRDRALLVAWAATKKAIIPFQVYWIARAFGLDLPSTAYLFQVVFLGFLVFLAASFGIRGTYQAGMVVALGFYGVPKEIALAIALIVEVVSHGAAMALGLLFLWVEGITLHELRALPERWRTSAHRLPSSDGSPAGAGDERRVPMEILKAAQQYMQEITAIGDFFAKDRLKGQVLRQGDFTFVGTR